MFEMSKGLQIPNGAHSNILPPWSCSLYRIMIVNANNHFAIRNQTILFFQPRFSNININGRIQDGCSVIIAMVPCVFAAMPSARRKYKFAFST